MFRVILFDEEGEVVGIDRFDDVSDVYRFASNDCHRYEVSKLLYEHENRKATQ